MKELQPRVHCRHTSPRMSHSVFGGNGGHSKDTLTVKHWTGKPQAVREVPWSFRFCGDLDRFSFSIFENFSEARRPTRQAPFDFNVSTPLAERWESFSWCKSGRTILVQKRATVIS